MVTMVWTRLAFFSYVLISLPLTLPGYNSVTKGMTLGENCQVFRVYQPIIYIFVETRPGLHAHVQG